MGRLKKEKNRIANSNSSENANLKNIAHVKGTNFYRDAKKVKQVNLLKGGKAIRNSSGKIIKEADFQSKLPSGSVARTAPNRKWFGTFFYFGPLTNYSLLFLVCLFFIYIINLY